MITGLREAKLPIDSTRIKWKYDDKAKEFHRRHNHARYAIDFIAALQAEMVDSALSKEHRVLAGIKRFAWGNLSDFAVDCMPRVGPDDPEPRRMNQAALARRLGMSTATVSEACSVLRARRYIRGGIDELWPDDRSEQESGSPPSEAQGYTSVGTGAESDSNSDYDSPFSQFRAGFLQDHPKIAQELNKHRTERDRLLKAAKEQRAASRRIELTILGAYRNAQRHSNSINLGADGVDGGTLDSAGVENSDSAYQPFDTADQMINTPQGNVQAPERSTTAKIPTLNGESSALFNLSTDTNIVSTGERSVGDGATGKTNALTNEGTMTHALIDGLVERGIPIAPDFANRILTNLGPTPLNFFFRILETKLDKARSKREMYKASWLPTTATDAAGAWPAAQKRLDAETRRSTEARLEDKRRNAIEVLRSDASDPLVAELRDDAVRVARGILEDPGVPDEVRKRVLALLEQMGEQ